MDEIIAIQEKILFQSEDGIFAVCLFRTELGEVITTRGPISMINPGESVALHGDWKLHPKHGRNFHVKDFRFIDPSSLDAIKKYLASGFIRGIGKVTAERLVNTFKENTFEILDSASKRLQEVEGIGKSRMKMIKESWDDQRALRTIMIFLQKHGLSINMASRIYHRYGMKAMEIIPENPYRMIHDIQGIGFTTADTIATKAGIEPEDPNRLQAILVHVLSEARNQGHTALPLSTFEKSFTKLCPTLDFPMEQLQLLVKKTEIRTIKQGEEWWFGRQELTDQEEHLASSLKKILTTPFSLKCQYIDQIMKKSLKGFPELTEEQQEACQRLFKEKVMIITGGPGTGKTTTLRAILKTQKMLGATIKLCAPTGRAAFQMQEATGHDASTIHRLLHYTGRGIPEYHANNPLACHLVVVDEVSMIDTALMYRLLDALKPDSKLLLVGDANQIPSVGPGRILADLIDSKTIPIIKLHRIFRQSGRSAIVEACHNVLKGISPSTPKDCELPEFHFVEIDNAERVNAMIIKLLKERIPKRFGIDKETGIQLLSPMYRGTTGVDRLNRLCQEELNTNTRGIVHRGTQLYLGDRVINLENNYDKMIFNGDCGIITGVDPARRNLTVKFADRAITFESDELDNLKLSYAITIHKSQGSEYPAVIIPILGEHYLMLRRNLLYTAISRGRQLVVLIGSKKALQQAVRNHQEIARLTLLPYFLEKNQHSKYPANS